MATDPLYHERRLVRLRHERFRPQHLKIHGRCEQIHPRLNYREAAVLMEVCLLKPWSREWRCFGRGAGLVRLGFYQHNPRYLIILCNQCNLNCCMSILHSRGAPILRPPTVHVWKHFYHRCDEVTSRLLRDRSLRDSEYHIGHRVNQVMNQICNFKHYMVIYTAGSR